jgi:recombination protein RecR
MLDDLIASFARLPGLGPRSGRRIMLHLARNRETALAPFIRALEAAYRTIRTCSRCGNLDIKDPCPICSDPRRNRAQLCVVEEVADLWAIERGHTYSGLYHVLGGTLSAIEGRGPEQLSVNALIARASETAVKEVILATNATVEGQTTAHYLRQRLEECEVEVSQLAHGIPVGGELDYLDDGTLATALRARLKL